LKIPEKAPDWTGTISADFMLDRISEIVKKANKDYLYWDKYKYLIPDGVPRESAWGFLKLIRTLQMKALPLRDNNEHTFGYWLPDSALQYLHFIDQNAGGQIVTGNPSIYVTEKRWYLMNSIVEEAISSSQIEGAATTRQVAADMLMSNRKPKDRSEQMIYNNYLTISKIKEDIGEPLTPELLKAFQASITNGTLENPNDEGRFRSPDDSPICVSDLAGAVLHCPPDAQKIPDSLRLLCDFANPSSGDVFIHPVIKGIILHFWLAYLHPFNDGNGRTARALFYWYMLKEKYWLFEYLSISRVILRTRAQYYRAFLYSEVDQGDMTYFLMYNLRAICKAIEQLNRYLDQRQKEALAAKKQWDNFPWLNYRQKAVLSNALINHDAVYTFESHMRTYNVVHQTARTDLNGLIDAGLFKKFKKGKILYFSAIQDLESKLI
jgi:Fic family protein